MYFNVPVSLGGTICLHSHVTILTLFQKRWHCFCSRKTFQTFRQTSSVLPHGRYCIHASLTSWPDVLPPDLCPCVCDRCPRVMRSVCVKPWLGDPTRATGDGGHGTAAAPCSSLSPSAASRGPRVLRSLRFQPILKTAQPVNTVSLILMSFIKYKYLLVT